MKVTIFIAKNNQFFDIERPPIDEARGGFHIGSRAKVCPHCLELWAYMKAESDPIFGIESQSCSSCSREYLLGVPGSLLDDRLSWTVDWDLIRYLPERLLRREFELHVKAFMKEDSHERYLTSNTTWHLPEGTNESQFAHIDTRTGAITPSRG